MIVTSIESDGGRLFQREVVAGVAGPLVRGEVRMEQAVRSELQAVGLVAKHIEICSDLRGMPPRPS